MAKLRSMAAGLAACLMAPGATAAPPAPFNPAVVFTPDHANGLYGIGETVGWTLRAPLGLGGQRFTYTIRRNDFTEIRSGSIDLSSGVGRIETKLDEPGMVYVRLTPADGLPTPAPGPAELDRLTVGAAVAPTQLRPSAPRPADFDAFWAGKLAALKRIAINPVLVPAASDRENVALSIVTLDSLNSHVHGYVAAPKRPGRFPALVVFQYAGVYPLDPKTATARAAEGWLTLDVDAHDMAPTEATAPQNYREIGNTDRETSYFLAMYLRDTRALDYIQSRPDWDGHTIVLMGTSMGGQQSLVTAGLNPGRVTAVIVNVPSGADSHAELHGRKQGYPDWPVQDSRVARTALYFDTVNFASRIRAPTLAAMGLIDQIAVPAGIFTAFNQIPAPKEAVPMIDSDHNNYSPQQEGAFYRRSREVLDGIMKTGRVALHTDWATRP